MLKNLLWLILGGTGPKEKIDDGCGCIFVIAVGIICAIAAIFYFFIKI